MSLIQSQERAVREMQAPRTSQKRELKHARSVVAAYIAEAARIGYSKEQVLQQARDIWDMYHLETAAESA